MPVDNDNGLSQNEVNDKMEDDEGPTGITFPLLIYDLKQQITCKVNPDDSLWTLKRRVLSNTNAKKFADGLNYGFYCPANSGRLGKYLSETRQVKEFSEKDLRNLQFRCKKKNYKDLPSNLKTLKSINDLSHRKSFIQAIISNRMSDVTRLLKKGIDPNYQDFKTGETPMTIAITSGVGSETLVRLVEDGAHLDYRNSAGMAPLHVAAINGNLDSVKTLLDLGASPNSRNFDNLTPLHCLSDGPNLESLIPCCMALLENYSVVDVADEAGNTELHHAAKHGRLTLSKRLIMYGANVNRQNAVGNTPLHIAIFNNQELLARKLLVYGAEKSITNLAIYDAINAAIMVDNKELVEHIQTFEPSHSTPIEDKPFYHPKRKADKTRRPSMLAFLSQQKTSRSKTSLTQQLSCPVDSGVEDDLNSSGGSNRYAVGAAAGLTTPDSQDVNKIGDYISEIFSSIQEDEVSKTFKSKTNNHLFPPVRENQRSSSFNNVNSNNFSDDFTDSESEGASEMFVAVPRSLMVEANQGRPASMYVDSQNAKEKTLITYAMKNQMEKQSSTKSLPSRESPMPVKKLKPSPISQQDEKVASIRSYPKRLIDNERQSLDSGYEQPISPVTLIALEIPRVDATPQSASTSPTSVKHRPNLKDIFPYDSVTDISTLKYVETLPKESPPEASTSFSGSSSQTMSFQLVAVPRVLPEINARENIYDEIPSVQVTSLSSKENINQAVEGLRGQPALSLNDSIDANISLNKTVTQHPSEDEIYANIGVDGLALSYRRQGNDDSETKHKDNQVRTPAKPPPAPTALKTKETPEQQNNEVLAATTAVMAVSAIEDHDNSSKTATVNQQQWARKQQELQQEMFNQQEQQLQKEILNQQQKQLEQEILNQQQKQLQQEILNQQQKQLQQEILNQQQQLEQEIFNQQQQQKQDKIENDSKSNYEDAILAQKKVLQESQSTGGNLRMTVVPPPPIPQQPHVQTFKPVQQYGQIVQQNQRNTSNSQQIEAIATNSSYTLPRDQSKYTRADSRPMSTFFETSQLSLQSLDPLDSPDSSKFGTLPTSKKGAQTDGRSKSVGKLNENNIDILNQAKHSSFPVATTEGNVNQNRNKDDTTNDQVETHISTLLIPAKGVILKATSYQDISNSKDTDTQLKQNQQTGTKIKHPPVPPKPPKRTSSIPGVTSPLTLTPPPAQLDLSPAMITIIPPPPLYTSQDESHEIMHHDEIPSYELLRSRNSRTPSPSRSGIFEPYIMTQDDIKRRMNQLRLSSGEETIEGMLNPSSDDTLSPNSKMNVNRSNEFSDTRAKIEKLFPLNAQPPNPARDSLHSPGQNVNPRVVYDKKTGQSYLRIHDEHIPHEWSA